LIFSAKKRIFYFTDYLIFSIRNRALKYADRPLIYKNNYDFRDLSLRIIDSDDSLRISRFNDFRRFGTSPGLFDYACGGIYAPIIHRFYFSARDMRFFDVIILNYIILAGAIIIIIFDRLSFWENYSCAFNSHLRIVVLHICPRRRKQKPKEAEKLIAPFLVCGLLNIFCRLATPLCLPFFLFAPQSAKNRPHTKTPVFVFTPTVLRFYNDCVTAARHCGTARCLGPPRAGQKRWCSATRRVRGRSVTVSIRIGNKTKAPVPSPPPGR
jgi:hypothetical protein